MKMSEDSGSESSEVIEDEEVYEVERIVDKKIEHGVTWYFLKWKNYPESQNSWETEESLNCPLLLKEYEDKLKEKPYKSEIVYHSEISNDNFDGAEGNPLKLKLKRTSNYNDTYKIKNNDDDFETSDDDDDFSPDGESNKRKRRDSKDSKKKKSRFLMSSDDDDDVNFTPVASESSEKKKFKKKTTMFKTIKSQFLNDQRRFTPSTTNSNGVHNNSNCNSNHNNDIEKKNEIQEPIVNANNNQISTNKMNDNNNIRVEKQTSLSQTQTSMKPRKSLEDFDKIYQRKETFEKYHFNFDRGYEPEKIIGITDLPGHLAFYIQYKNQDSKRSELVPASICKQRWPSMVIEFYQERFVLNVDDDSN